MVAEITGAVNGITNLIGSGQQRKAQQAEQRNQVLQMVLASRMQPNQINHVQNENTNPTQKNNTGFIVGGIVLLIIIVLIGLIVWKQQQRA